MAVYVDDARHRLGRMKMCRMTADTEQEMHDMARRVGVERRHFQGDHYDICQSKRAEAVKKGAIPVASKEIIRVILRRGGRRKVSK